MGSIVDYILIIVILFSFWRGWHKGLLDIILGPLSLVIAIGGSWWWYHQSQNIPISLAIGLIGPIALRIIIWFFGIIFGLTHQKKEQKSTPSIFLSFITGCLNAVWGTSLFLSALVGVVLLPIKSDFVKTAQKDIKYSQVYALMQNLSNKQLPEKPISDVRIKEWTKPINGGDEGIWRK